jgi:putative aldouronate transport system substrate-binding protein
MMVGTLTGCKGKKEDASKTTTPASFSGRFDQTKEIKIPVYDRGVQGEPDVTNNYWTKWISEKALKDINVKVTYVSIPRNQDVDKFNMLLAANEAPDVIYSYDYPVISSFYSRNAFQEIKPETLNTYGPNLKKFLGDKLLSYGQIKGKQMLIPASRPMMGDYASTIRQDWLDKLNLKAPTTNDEMYNVLKAFKTQDPGGVGKDKVIPMAMSGFGNNSQSTPYWSYLADNMVDTKDFAMYSDLIVTPLTWEPAKKALKQLNKYYNEGLISPEFALDTDSKKAQAAISNGLVGVFSERISKSPPIFTTLKNNIPTAKFTALGPIMESGYKAKGYGYYPYGMMNGISKASKNPEAVIAFMDWMSKSENLTVLQNGVLDKTYKMQDGLPLVDSAYKGEERLILGTNKDYFCLVTEARNLGDDDKNIKAKSLSDAPEGFGDYFVQNYKASLQVMNTNNYAFASPVTTLTKNSNTLKAKYQEFGTKLIMCKPDEFESLYAQLSKDYLAAGYQEILDEKAKLYDAEKAAK